MLVNILVFSPFVIALIMLLLPKSILKISSLIVSFGLLAIVGYSYILLKSNPLSHDLSSSYVWINSMNANWSFALDGFSLLMVFLTCIVSALIFATIRSTHNYNKTFYALAWLMIGAILGVFTTKDGFVFYVLWEVALIPIYFICLIWGGENKAKITFKFFAYTLFGSLLMLASLLYLYQNSLNGWDINALYSAGRSMSLVEQNFVFWGIFLAFAIKLPIFPFHTWQPDTYTIAPTQGTMLLSGLMLKMGTYGIARWLLPMVPDAVAENSHYAIVLSVIGVVYASCIAMVQKDLKRMMAWASIAHVGLISAGLFVANTSGINGAFLQMLSHGINVVACFFVVDVIYERTKTNEMKALGGIRGVAPIFGFFFLIVVLANIAMPLTNGFAGEFLLLNGVFEYQKYIAALAAISVVLSAAYMLKAYQKVMLGETKEATISFYDLLTWEKTVFVSMTLLVFIFGLFPNAIIQLLETNVLVLLATVAQ